MPRCCDISCHKVHDSCYRLTTTYASTTLGACKWLANLEICEMLPSSETGLDPPSLMPRASSKTWDLSCFIYVLVLPALFGLISSQKSSVFLFNNSVLSFLAVVNHSFRLYTIFCSTASPTISFSAPDAPAIVCLYFHALLPLFFKVIQSVNLASCTPNLF